MTACNMALGGSCYKNCQKKETVPKIVGAQLQLNLLILLMVGAEGFEPSTLCSQILLGT